MYRISKDKYYLFIAKQVSMRSTCLRRRYGAVIVKDDEIKATGYNGSPRGESNCCDIGICQRDCKGHAQWQGYEDCCAVHAEMNALLSAKRSDIFGGKLYLFGYDLEAKRVLNDAHPCPICKKLVANAGLEVINFAKLDR